tara:strand:+ start:2422 stop:2856 length:435 start_codon:yes stop_codon:yes gene_type:complete
MMIRLKHVGLRNWIVLILGRWNGGLEIFVTRELKLDNGEWKIRNVSITRGVFIAKLMRMVLKHTKVRRSLVRSVVDLFHGRIWLGIKGVLYANNSPPPNTAQYHDNEYSATSDQKPSILILIYYETLISHLLRTRKKGKIKMVT